MKSFSILVALFAMLCIVPVATAQDEDSAGVKVGDRAPDFDLETFDGETVKLSERFGDEGHPVILLFSRANW